MKESTKIVGKTVLATSGVGVLFLVGLLALFPSIKAKIVGLLAQPNQVAGRDTPIIIRGGSIVAKTQKSSGGWTEITPGDPSGYSTDVNKVCRKSQIFVSGEDLDESMIDESNSPWEIDVSSRKNDGSPRPTPDSGLRICSEPNCDLSKGKSPDTKVYMYVLDKSNDAIMDPDADDEDDPSAPKIHLKKYQRCTQCDYVSNIYVLDSTHLVATAPTPTSTNSFKCQNSDCRVHIGKLDSVKCTQ